MGGSDGSLSNHRPLVLIEVLRKVFTGIAVDRMRRDWSRLKVLGECNPGFQAGRTTTNAILPVRTAAEHCVATKTEMAVLLDDLKWCFDTPANAVIELAVKRAMNEAAELSAAEDGPQPTPALLAYSDGSVTANGALGSAAAILCIGVHDVSAVVRLASADTALSSERSEWAGLLLVSYIAKHVRGDLVVRLDDLQVANAFTDGQWRFRRNWLRRNDRDLASLA